jgi:hypothetical protein
MINWKGLPGVYMQNEMDGEESQIAESQIVCERESIQ